MHKRLLTISFVLRRFTHLIVWILQGKHNGRTWESYQVINYYFDGGVCYAADSKDYQAGKTSRYSLLLNCCHWLSFFPRLWTLLCVCRAHQCRYSHQKRLPDHMKLEYASARWGL